MQAGCYLVEWPHFWGLGKFDSQTLFKTLNFKRRYGCLLELMLSTRAWCAQQAGADTRFTLSNHTDSSQCHPQNTADTSFMPSKPMKPLCACFKCGDELGWADPPHLPQDLQRIAVQMHRIAVQDEVIEKLESRLKTISKQLRRLQRLNTARAQMLR